MRVWKIVVWVAVAVLVPSSGACARPTEAVSQVTDLVAQADAAPTPRLDWKPCAESELSRYQCAVAAVPLDYAQPSGRTLSLALVRRPAAGSAHRHPVHRGRRTRRIRLEPGEYGELFSGEIARRFDLVTFDQRGIGRGQVRCFANPEEQQRFWSSIVLPPTNPDQETTAARAARELSAGCAADGPYAGAPHHR